MPSRRLVAVERKHHDLWIRGIRHAKPGEKLTVGRDGELRLAADPIDLRVSRYALTVTAGDDGWRIRPNNRHGVVLHLWAQPPRLLTHAETVMWPRIGLLVHGSDDREHWVLLEDDETYTILASPLTTTSAGVSSDLPGSLTTAQQAALRCLFHPLLAWPPSTQATLPILHRVASELGRSEAALKERLQQVRAKARRLGLRRDVLLTDPEYFYLLVRGGYLAISDEDIHVALRT